MSSSNTKKDILVYADWKSLPDPELMGVLSASSVKGKETFSFEYMRNWLDSGFTQMIDPDLQLFSGKYYPKDDKTNFGIFLDSCPDRWGRVLIQKREAILAKLEGRKSKTLLESDYLLGVFDYHRMGALRFKLEEDGPFLNDNTNLTTPPWTSLRELQNASLKFEEDDLFESETLKWINMLLAPGSSLGGARPKASIEDVDHNLWIAKFPSKNDDYDVGAWEMVTFELAKNAGINVANGEVQQFNSRYHTFLTKRFDRTNKGERIHFASAMTQLGKKDGEDSQGTSYLEIAEFIIRHGKQVEKDLEELWRRIAFNICVKNTDDHLRNHGFLLTNSGWELSPAYDLNPNIYGTNLSLNINENNNSLDLDLALEVAPYFRLDLQKAEQILQDVKNSIKNWRSYAIKFKISYPEQERMSVAFYNA